MYLLTGGRGTPSRIRARSIHAVLASARAIYYIDTIFIDPGGEGSYDASLDTGTRFHRVHASMHTSCLRTICYLEY